MLRLLFLLCMFSFNDVSAMLCGNGSSGNYPPVSTTTGLNELAGQIRGLLQIDLTSSGGKQQPVEDQWTVVPPKYMLDLYHKYADESFILETDPRLTTTVRCLLGKVRRDVVHFNLSSLVDVGSVSRAEVHVFRRASRGKASRTKFSFAQHRIRLRNLPKKFLSTIISLMPSRGWQAVDITSTIQTSLGKAKLLSMTVEASIPEFGTGRARYHTIPVDEVLRVAYRPFLVIFSYSEPLSTSVSSMTTTLPATAAAAAPLSSSSFSSSSSARGGRRKWDETMPNKRKHPYHRSYSTNPPTSDGYPPLDNYNENFDELENSLQSILNVDKIGKTIGGENNLVDRDVAGFENNEIGESSAMDHFHFFRSSGLPKSMAEIPLINHSNSVVKKRSIEDNEFSTDDAQDSFQYSNNARRPEQQRALNENPTSWNDADDPDNSVSNSLSSQNSRSNSKSSSSNHLDERNPLLLQDNLDNELTSSVLSPASSSPSSSSSLPSSKEGNPNPILPYPRRSRWWNEPLDHYWTQTSSKSRSRRRGKMNRRKKLRTNRQGKKYWTTRRTPPPPTIPSLVTNSLITDAEPLNKAEDAEEEGSTKKVANCRVEELSMDAANFDWAERVIAPAVFPLNFCHGSCFHLRKYEDVSAGGSSMEEADSRNPDFDYPSISSTSSCCSPSRKKREASVSSRAICLTSGGPYPSILDGNKQKSRCTAEEVVRRPCGRHWRNGYGCHRLQCGAALRQPKLSMFNRFVRWRAGAVGPSSPAGLLVGSQQLQYRVQLRHR